MDDSSFLASAPGALVLSLAIMLVCAPFRATPKIPNWVTPYVALFLGAMGYCLLEGFTFRHHLIGIVIGGCAVGLHQSIKQGRIGIREILGRQEEAHKSADSERRSYAIRERETAD